MYITLEDSWKSGNCIQKRILQNLTTEKETKPSKHTKKEAEEGCNWKPCSIGV